jgi:hypothetical protein
MKKKININGGDKMISFATVMLIAGIGIPIMAAMTLL